MSRTLAIVGILVIVASLIASDSFFTVTETQQALVIQLGEPKRVIQEPGLQFKIPGIQNVVYYEDRVLNVDPPVEQVILSDQRRLDVDAFARYRIVDPLLFFQAVGTESVARQRLSTFIIASLREVVGRVTQVEVLSGERAAIMNRIRDQVGIRALALGVEIVDVRLVRADVPEGTVQSVYDRMRSEREREAAEFRAQGFERSQEIKARADRERTVILAEAQREAQMRRGEGDESAILIRGLAFNADREFYQYYRTLEAYRESFNADDTTLVLSPNSRFFRFFNEGPEGITMPRPGEFPAPSDATTTTPPGG